MRLRVEGTKVFHDISTLKSHQFQHMNLILFVATHTMEINLSIKAYII